MDDAYRRLFEDKWFGLDSDSDAEDKVENDKDQTVAALRNAQTLRDLGALNFYHFSKSNHSSTATCYLLQSDLQRYERIVKPPAKQHIYLDDCMQLLSMHCPENTKDDWQRIVGNVGVEHIVAADHKPLDCVGKYLECKNDEIQSIKDLNLPISNVTKSPASARQGDDEIVDKPAEKKPKEDDIRSKMNNTKWTKKEQVLIDENKPTTRKRTGGPNKHTFGGDPSHFECTNNDRNPSNAVEQRRVSVLNRNSKWIRFVAEDEELSSRSEYGAKRRRQDNGSDDNIQLTNPPSTTPPSPPATVVPVQATDFSTAREQLAIAERKRNERAATLSSTANGVRKTLGGRVKSKFVSPLLQDSDAMSEQPPQEAVDDEPTIDERLRHIDAKMVELIRSEIMAPSGSRPIGWDDIAGLQYAKATIREAVVWPMLRPDIFTGLRRPPRGILLFGPPGTGKTLIGKCIAAQSQSTFFSISASSLTSKWIGDGEKMVRALFAVAAVHQPAVIFIDEIDSLLSQRSDTEHESSRRLKTEFLVQLDGAATADDERILIVGATNRPQELDEAARRRLVKRLYVPLPDQEARRQILENLMRLERCSLTAEQIRTVAQATDGFSGADMKVLCHEASMGPIRAIGTESQMEAIQADAVRAVAYEDFAAALRRVRSSVSTADLAQYVRWDATYGSGAMGI